MNGGALGLGLGLALLAPLPCQGSNRAQLLGLLNGESASLLIRLPSFDDEELQNAAAAAVSRGAKVRLILDRRQKSGRLAAARLRAAGMQLRWSSKKSPRFIVSGAGKLALGNFDGEKGSLEALETGVALIEDPGLAREFRSQFEGEWPGLKEALPSETELKDELEALPDPRENEPRLRTKRRRN